MVTRRHPYLSVRKLAIGPESSGIAMKIPAIQAVLPLLSPKYSKKCGKNTPKLKVIPSAIRLTMNEAKTTTQPQPPSGGRASAIETSSSSEELELELDTDTAAGGDCASNCTCKDRPFCFRDTFSLIALTLSGSRSKGSLSGMEGNARGAGRGVSGSFKASVGGAVLSRVSRGPPWSGRRFAHSGGDGTRERSIPVGHGGIARAACAALYHQSAGLPCGHHTPAVTSCWKIKETSIRYELLIINTLWTHFLPLGKTDLYLRRVT